MARKKFQFQEPGQYAIEPYDPMDRFVAKSWKNVCAGFHSQIPETLVAVLRKHAGCSFAMPVCFGSDQGYEETDIFLDMINGPRLMQESIAYLQQNFGVTGVLPFLSGLWNLVYVVDGNMRGCVVESEYFEGEYAQDSEEYFSVELDTFLNNLWFAPELYFPDEPLDCGLRLIPEALRGNWSEIHAALSSGLGVDEPMDSTGWTLLSYAARSNQVDLLRRLIERGADVDRMLRIDTPNGESYLTALAIIAMNGVNLSAAKVLLEAGADVTVAASSGHNWFDLDVPAPLMLRLLKNYGFSQETPTDSE